MLNAILSTNGGILGEVIEFWETTQGFIEGRAQRTLPVGIDGDSRKHHRLSTDGVKHLTGGAMELITKIREELRSFFSEPPPDDLSLLLSPVPPTPDSPVVVNPTALSPGFNKFDPGSIPPPSPRRGESWEKYGFWPPYATSISGSYYLSKFLALIGTASCEMATLSIVKSGRNNLEDIKKMLGEIRERCLSAILAAWTLDSENCKMLEDWTRSPDRHDLTNMPARFRNFQGFLLANLQQLMYISEATRRSDTPEVIIPPSTKLLQGVRSQFVTSIYNALRGMVQKAKNPDNGDEGWTADADGLAVKEKSAETVDGTSAHLDSSNKVRCFMMADRYHANNTEKMRILITLSNVQNLRNDIIPHLVTQFETNFSVQLTDESKSIQEELSKIDTDLFRFYTEPVTKTLGRIIKEGITSASWLPSGPDARREDARPYVYSVLLELVLVHTEVSTTANPLTAPILKHLLEQSSIALLAAFQTRPQYSLAALQQATLDVEFLAQTMNNYTTEKAGETQNRIYVELDKRADIESRTRLQGELKEMREALKRLRERSRVEFGCFKRVREGRSGTVTARSGPRE
jgi:exocyst complex component 2